MSATSPAASRALAVFDLDGTITRFDTLGAFLGQCLARRPWRVLRLALGVPALLRFPFDRDRGALKGALVWAALGGLPRAWLGGRVADFVRWVVRDALYQEALAAIEMHRSRADRLVLMSASIDLYVPEIARALGFELTICSAVRWRGDGRLEGRLSGPNCRGEEKQRQLQSLIERERPSRVYAYGNSASDLSHMQLAQEGFLVNGPQRLSVPPTVQRVRWAHRPQAGA